MGTRATTSPWRRAAPAGPRPTPGERLARPWPTLASVAAWLVATAAFCLMVWVAGGPVTGDAHYSTVAADAIAHGEISCAYPPSGVPGYAPDAPVYVLVSAGLIAALRIGASTPFPSGSQLGPHCASASVAINAWSTHARAQTPTLWLGLVGWVGLLAGVVALLRACGRGRCGWEALAALLVAVVPTTFLCLVEFFHPPDLLALGLALCALAAARTDRWALAGVLVALAVLTQQFALLVAVPLLVLAPPRRRARLLVAAGCTVVAIAVPLAALTDGRALPTVVVGTGDTELGRSALTSLFHGGRLATVVSRVLPLVLAAVVAGVAVDRLGGRALDPVPLLSVAAASLALRLVFELSTWGYYLMAVGVTLVLLDVVAGRLRGWLVAWFVLVGTLLVVSPVFGTPALPAVPLWLTQLVVDGGALALALAPLARLAWPAPAGAAVP